MTEIIHTTDAGPSLLAADQRRLCLYNIAACQRYKLDPSVLPPLWVAPQQDYTVKPLKAPMPAPQPPAGPSKRKLRHTANAAKYEQLYGRRAAQAPVQVTAVAPFPNSVSLVD